MIQELKNPLTDDYKKFKKIVLSPEFHWNNIPKTTEQSEKNDLNLFTHVLISRPEKQYFYPMPVSTYTDMAAFIVSQILDYNNVTPSCYYRMCVNYVTSKTGISEKHVDHNFSHKNLLIYLNKFSDGETIVYDKNNKKFVYQPKENSVIIFDGKNKHCHKSSSDGKRIVLVATFV